MPQSKKKRWYKKKEFWGIVAIAGNALKLAPDHTFANDLGGFFLATIPITLWMGLVDGYKADNLPSGLSKMMDKLPNEVTGIRGSKK